MGGYDVIQFKDVETGKGGVFYKDDAKLSPTGSGVPTYWSPDKKDFAYYPGGDETKWFVSDAPTYKQIQEIFQIRSYAKYKEQMQDIRSYAKLDKTEFKCGS